MNEPLPTPTTKTNWWLIIAAVGATAFLCACMAIGLVLSGFMTPNIHVSLDPTATPLVSIQAPPVEPTSTLAPAATEPPTPTAAGWVGDDFGPEQVFPAVIKGPAIAEINGENGYCAVVKVNEGETLNWRGKGAWWQAFSQAALNARWTHHLAEYMAKWSKCSVFEHAYDVK